MTPKPRLHDGAGPPPEDIRAHLARLLGTVAFRASDRRRRLLGYVVEQTLVGHADRLKAFDLAVAVLGRDDRFDPQHDPIVRVEVRRLRRDLEHYYLTDGRDDPIRITIAKGHYVPTFERAGPTFTPEAEVEAVTPPPIAAAFPLGWRVGALAGLGVLAVGIGCWALWQASRRSKPPRP
jgi:adenylate cyclase